MCVEAYVAAFVDGEGCIQVRSSGWPQVLVANTDLAVLERMRAEMGVGYIRRNERALRGNRKPCWQWACHGREAIVLLRQILPWLRIKRSLAERAVLYQWRPPGRPPKSKPANTP